MKKILLICLILLSAATLPGQNLDQRLSIVFRNVSLEEALTLLIDQHTAPLFFNNASIPKKRINNTFRNYKLEAILDYLLLETELSYKISEGGILIEKTRELPRKKFFITGNVIDDRTGENLVGATVYLPELATGTYTNEYGQFSLHLPQGKWELYFSHIGYTEIAREIKLNQDTSISTPLVYSITFDPITLWDTSNTHDQLPIDWNLEKIDLKEQALLPRFGGETDLIRTIHLLPGVQSGADGIGGIKVRGGGAGHNLITVDGVPVYNSNHAVGLLSVFNPDVIKTTKFLKGAYPARYEGRLASVLDIRTRDGNYRELSGSTHIGLLSGRALLEGPLFSEETQKSSFLIAGRWSIVNQFLEPRIRAYKNEQGETGSSNYRFNDINAKLNYHFSPRSKLFLSFYRGNDEFDNFGFQEQRFRLLDPNTNNLVHFRTNQEYDEYVNWGNDILALRWNKELKPQLFANTTFTYSSLSLNFGYNTLDSLLAFTPEELFNFELNAGLFQSSIRDIALKIDFDWYAGLNHYIRFGARSGFLSFQPGVLRYDATTLENAGSGIQGNRQVDGRDVSFYAENTHQILPKLTLNYGAHLNIFFVDQKNYWSLQPRVSFNWQASSWLGIQGSVRKTNQFMHLLSSSTIGLPTDMWVPSTRNIQPASAIQFALGTGIQMNRNWALELEGYYKKMDNLLNFSEGITFVDDWETNVTPGQGEAYGIDIKLEKQFEKLRGWASYSYAYATRNFDRINFGETFPFKYDRRHDLKIAVIYEWSDQWSVSSSFLLGSGLAYSLPNQNFTFQLPGENSVPVTILDFGSKNQYRLPHYHRLDLGINYKFSKWGLDHQLYAGVTNLYNHSNPLYYRLRSDIGAQNGNLVDFRQFVGVQALPLLPSVNISSKF